MINLKVENKIYKLPENFNEVYLYQYQELVELNYDEKLSPKEILIEKINILTGIPRDIIEIMDLKQVMFINEKLEFLNKKSDGSLVEYFKIDNVLYGFDKLENDKYEVAKFFDLEEFSKSSELVYKNIHILMSILYRPIKANNFSYLKLIKEYFRKDKRLYYTLEKYDSSSVLKRAEIFKYNMKMDVVMSAILFFSLLKMTYTQITNGYSIQEIETSMMLMFNHLKMI